MGLEYVFVVVIGDVVNFHLLILNYSLRNKEDF